MLLLMLLMMLLLMLLMMLLLLMLLMLLLLLMLLMMLLLLLMLLMLLLMMLLLLMLLMLLMLLLLALQSAKRNPVNFAGSLGSVVGFERGANVRIIETDNFGRDYPDEHFVEPLPRLTKEAARQICAIVNGGLPDNHPRYWCAVPDDYVLAPGFEP